MALLSSTTIEVVAALQNVGYLLNILASYFVSF